MNESVFRDLLGESLRREYAEYEHVPEHKFSFKHWLTMKRIFAQYERNKSKPHPEPDILMRNATVKQRIVIVGITLILTAFLAGCVWISVHLYRIDHNAPEGYTVNEAAVSQMKNQLISEGIDVESRIPTHAISDEQTEWLSSRYDLNFLSACSFTHEEFGKFMLDLAYLNVFSFDEVENFYVVLPFNSNHSGYLYKHESGTDSGGYVEPFEKNNSILSGDELQIGIIEEYLKEKFTELSEDEYEEKAKELFEQRRECLLVLESFFANISGPESQTSSDKGFIVNNISY